MSMPVNSFIRDGVKMPDHCVYGLVNRKYGILYRTQLRELEVRRRKK